MITDRCRKPVVQALVSLATMKITTNHSVWLFFLCGSYSHQLLTERNSYFKAVTRGKRYVTYPSGTAIGLLVAIALPIDIPEENLYFSLNLEANYNLPDNITQYYDSDVAKTLHSISRRKTYSLLENALDIEWKNGHECLLRTICEASKYSMKNDVLASILHIVFTPSASKNEENLEEYYEAEIFGHTGSDCSKLYSRCPVNLLDFISSVQ